MLCIDWIFLNVKTIAKIPQIHLVALSFHTNVQHSEKSFCVVRSSILKKWHDMIDPQPNYHASFLLDGVTISDEIHLSILYKQIIESFWEWRYVASIDSLSQAKHETFQSSCIRFTTSGYRLTKPCCHKKSFFPHLRNVLKK